jgi:hypothetical protein
MSKISWKFGALETAVSLGVKEAAKTEVVPSRLT